MAHNEVPIWLGAADIFVLPTKDEGCCNAILEALTCGLPTVSSDRSFNHEILTEKVALLVEPSDPIALRKAIVALAENPRRRAEMGAMAAHHARNFVLERRTERMRAYLSKLKSQMG